MTAKSWPAWIGDLEGTPGAEAEGLGEAADDAGGEAAGEAAGEE